MQYINIKSVENLLKYVELFETVQSMSNSIYTSIGRLNKLSGDNVRLGIIRALYRSTELLILDEATNAIDFLQKKKS